MDDVTHLLLGGALVAIGVVAAALADRIRGVRSTRESVPRAAATTRSKPLATRNTSIAANDTTQEDVIGALVSAGYPKRVAAAATAGCTPQQRSTPEVWTRAALAALRAGGGLA